MGDLLEFKKKATYDDAAGNVTTENYNEIANEMMKDAPKSSVTISIANNWVNMLRSAHERFMQDPKTVPTNEEAFCIAVCLGVPISCDGETGMTDGNGNFRLNMTTAPVAIAWDDANKKFIVAVEARNDN